MPLRGTAASLLSRSLPVLFISQVAMVSPAQSTAATHLVLLRNSTLLPNGTNFHGKRTVLMFKEEYHIPWVCFSCAIMLANILVLCVFKSDKNLLKRTPANHLLLSLAFNDLMTGLVSLLQVLPYFEQEAFKPIWSTYPFALDLSITFLSLGSVIHLCLLAAERYLSIFYALQFKGLVTTRRVRYCILSTWAASCTIALAPITWMWRWLQGAKDHATTLKAFKINAYYSAFVTLAFALLPLVLLAIAYIRMFLMCRILIREAPDNLLARRKTVNKELKILFMYFIMYLVFLVLCIPFFGIRLAVDIKAMFGMKVELKLPSQLLETFVLTRYLASGFNPFIYTIYKQDFRRTIQSYTLVSRAFSSFHGCSQVQSGDGNETCTKEVFHSFGNHLSTLKKTSSEIGLVDVSTNLLTNAKDSNHVVNGSNRLHVHQQSRF